MKKLEIDKIIIVLGIMVFILEICLISCQSPADPLLNAKFPCTVIDKGFQYTIWIKCEDSIYAFADHGYSNAFEVDSIIYKPLNK